ncbi:MAG TPA: hypothetical protein VIC56_08695 [Gemmatimonadota bacterium]|jgi:hypothetical protein
MGSINWGRVILGGLVAGLIVNIAEIILNVLVLPGAFEAAMQERGIPYEESSQQIAIWILWAFLFGIAAVWLYAAIRPRFGPGPGTALKAGFAAWFLASFLSTIAMLNMGLFPTNLLAIGFVWGLVEMLLATLAGAWVYREA